MKNKKQMAAVLLSAILGITANSWFVQADSSVIQDDQQEPDNEAPDSDKVTEGTDTYKGFLLDNVLHSSEEGDIHYNVYIPDSYDGSKPYALLFTLPGYEGLYFQGVGVNIKAEEFGFAAQEYNPEIRTEQITKALELALSLLSLMFGYGTKKYSFEGGQIKTATEYFGERQDSMQELNRQRQAAKRYIQDIVKAVLWFANTFQGGSWDLGADVNVEFDDSYITDKDAEMEQMRSDAVSFSDIPIFRIRYVMARLNCDEEQARQYIAEGQQDPDLGDETDD